MTTHNTSGLQADQIDGLFKLGQFRNNWRQRTVTVYAHPSGDANVITVGVGTTETFICCEPRSLYAQRIDGDDWSDYN